MRIAHTHRPGTVRRLATAASFRRTYLDAFQVLHMPRAARTIAGGVTRVRGQV